MSLTKDHLLIPTRSQDIERNVFLVFFPTAEIDTCQILTRAVKKNLKLRVKLIISVGCEGTCDCLLFNSSISINPSAANFFSVLC